jgi:hypothetical protein
MPSTPSPIFSYLDLFFHTSLMMQCGGMNESTRPEGAASPSPQPPSGTPVVVTRDERVASQGWAITLRVAFLVLISSIASRIRKKESSSRAGGGGRRRTLSWSISGAVAVIIAFGRLRGWW